MPIEVMAEILRPTDEEFAALAYDVMACAFAVHNEIGRFCDEKIYKRLVAKRFGDIQLEVPVHVAFEKFRKNYFVDMLARNRAIFEWKAVERLAPEHRAQLLNYLLLSDLPRGKLVNVRPELIEHEFVNTTLRPDDRRRFRVDRQHFRPLDKGDESWYQFLTAALQDWGAGLDLHLYEAAIAHVFGGEDAVLSSTKIYVEQTPIGEQKVRRTSSGATYKVTALYENQPLFEQHARRFLDHTKLPAIHWINITRQLVRIKTLERNP